METSTFVGLDVHKSTIAIGIAEGGADADREAVVQESRAKVKAAARPGHFRLTSSRAWTRSRSQRLRPRPR